MIVIRVIWIQSGNIKLIDKISFPIKKIGTSLYGAIIRPYRVAICFYIFNPRQNTSIDHTCQITIIGIFSHTNNPYIIYAHGNQVIINGIQKAEPASADSSIFMPKKDNTNITKIIIRANNFTIGIRIGVQIFQVEIPLGYNSTYD